MAISDQPKSPLDLASINALQMESVSEEADSQTTGEQHQIQIEHFRAVVESYKQDTTERKKYAKLIFWLCAAWVTCIFALLILSGFGLHFRLSDSVLLAAIGSTTANILGIFFIVARYLFPKR